MTLKKKLRRWKDHLAWGTSPFLLNPRIFSNSSTAEKKGGANSMACCVSNLLNQAKRENSVIFWHVDVKIELLNWTPREKEVSYCWYLHVFYFSPYVPKKCVKSDLILQHLIIKANHNLFVWQCLFYGIIKTNICNVYNYYTLLTEGSLCVTFFVFLNICSIKFAFSDINIGILGWFWFLCF